MKKIYFLICLISFTCVKSQVVFCPTGAEWHYLFNTYNLNPKPVYENETIKYIGDSIIGTDTVKVLSHKRFYNRYNTTYAGNTLIKQKGDTIFFRNKLTQHTWQILFNFAAGPGQGWSTVITTNSTPKTYNFSVSSVTYAIVNNQSLKVVDFSGTDVISSKITERFGANGFLFPFFKGPASDGDYLSMSLCYKDDTFGEYKYTEFPCDYSYAVGLNEVNKNRDTQIYPNPFTSELSFEGMTEGKIRLFSCDGKEVLSVNIESENRSQVINTEFLSSGFYYAKITTDNFVTTKKLVKE